MLLCFACLQVSKLVLKFGKLPKQFYKKLQANRDGSTDLIVDRLDFNQKDMNFTIAGDAPSKVSEFIEKNLGKKIKLSYMIRDGCAFCVYSAE